MIFGCISENKLEVLKNGSSTSNNEQDILKKKEVQNSNYNIIHVSDGYGKRLYIDSLHYDIVKRYYYKDSTKLWFVNYSDTKNDTTYFKEFYLNGKPKLIKKTSNNRFIKIGCWKYYTKNGNLIKQIDHDSKFPISFDNAIEIAKKNKIPTPFETSITKDSLNWIIMNWNETTYDTISKETKGHGLKINIKTGDFKKITKTRTVEI